MSKNHIHSYIIIFILFFVAIVSAQSAKKIFGYVYDFNSKQPLIGANVIIDGTSIGTATDEFGYFQFENLLTGTYSITVSYIGYKEKRIFDITVLRDQPTEINIYLNETINKLDEIIVAANGKTGFNGNIKYYTKEDIEKNNFQSVGELLQQAPGVEIQSTGGVGSAKKISIRGSEANQVLVMLDGVPLNNQFGGDADLSKIPTNIVERIEIYEGGSSSKFGSGAIGGAINIITKKNFKTEYKINLSGGSYGFRNVEPSISGNINDLSYFFSYNYIQSVGNYPYHYINTSGEEAEAVRVNADLKSQNIFARINYNLNNFLFSVNAQRLESERGLPGQTSALTAYARSNNTTSILGTNIKATFDNLVLDISGSYSQNKTENSNLYSDNAPPEYTRYAPYHYQYESDITVVNTTFHYKPTDWFFITAGYNGKHLLYNDKNFIETLNAPINSAEDISNGFFLHQEFNCELPAPFKRFSITPAIRYDEMRMTSNDLERHEDQWSPSVAFFLSIGEQNKIYFKSSISSSFRVPTFSDLFYQDVRIEGKPDLLPEKSLNKEIGFGWEINNWGKLKGEINLYRYSIEDMIVWKLGSFEIFHPFNEDAEITGQEYSLQYQLPKTNLELNVSYTYLQPLDKNNNETTYNKIIPYKPQHSLKSNVRFGYKEFSASVNYRFVGKRYATVANTVELQYYNVIDLSILQNINIGKLKTVLKFSITNLTNEFYEIIRNYSIPGREFRIGFALIY